MVLSMQSNVAEPEKAERDSVDRTQDYWKKEIMRAEKFFGDWWKRSDKLYRLYSKQGDQADGKRKFAMLWANTEVLKPSIYARPPIPQVSRRYRDKDPVGRLAAEILERASSYEFERMGLDNVLRSVRDDLLLPGRGQAWVRYEADIEEPEEEPGETPDDLPVQGVAPTIKAHKTIVDYIHYRQFLHQPARRWEEVEWVSKIVYMSDDEGKARFGEKWKGVPMDNKAQSTDSSGGDGIRDPKLDNAQQAQATIYEIWSKKHEKVFFVAKGAKDVLEEVEPFLDFEGFFPCPKPVYATLTNNSLIPTPDYKYYQDQAEEIDLLTARIGKLIDSLKLVGFYPAGAEGDVSSAMEKALSPSTESQMIPVASWAAFGERGGSNAIIWLPIRDVVETLRACIEVRNQAVQDVYQITGISDILRGQSEASETATAQSIKAQWGSVRVRDRQQEMVRFARDLTRMVCEVISEEYDPAYLMQVTNVEQPQPPQPMQPPPPPQPTGDPQQDQQAMMQAQQAQQQMMASYQQQVMAYQGEMQKLQSAFELLKNDDMRGYRIEIETDSTIQPDEDAEKQRRTEFVTAVGGLLQQAVPLVAQLPELAPLIGETILFTARGFRAGRQLEDQIEQAFQAIQDRLSQPQQQQPDPNAAIIEAKTKQAQLDLQHTEAKNQLELQHKQQLHDQEMQIKAEEANHQLVTAKAQSELGLNSGKAKLRDQILAEESAAFMGENPDQNVSGVTMAIQQAMQGILEIVQQSNASVAASNAEVMKALTAPKVITAPDGRTYTAQTIN